MKAVVLTIVLALVLAGGATAGGPHLRELVERVGLLEAADVEHEAELVELERRVQGLELGATRLRSRVACLTWKVAGRPAHKPNPCPRRVPAGVLGPR